MLLQILAVILVLFILYDLIKNGFSLVGMIMEIDPKEGDEKISTIRFMSLICFFLFIWITVYYALAAKTEYNFELHMIVGILAFVPKLFQKFAEKYIGTRFTKKEE